MIREAISIFIALLLLLNCSTKNPTAPIAPNTPAVDRFNYPLTIGNTWVYQVISIADSVGKSDTIALSDLTLKVIDTLRINNLKCYKISTMVSYYSQSKPLYFGADANGNTIAFDDSIPSQIYHTTLMPFLPADGQAWIDSVKIYSPNTGSYIGTEPRYKVLSRKTSISTPSGIYSNSWEMLTYSDSLRQDLTATDYSQDGIGLVKTIAVASISNPTPGVLYYVILSLKSISLIN